MSVGDAAPFTALAGVYDEIMADIEYGEWAQTILEFAAKQGYSGGPILDLGCGTGNSTAPFVERGFSIEGLDASAEMLAVARRKLPGVPFHLGEFETFKLNGRFALVISIFDSLNNLLTDESLSAAVLNVYDHLVPGGVFVFDVNTDAGLRELWEGGVASGFAGEVYYRWEHSYDHASGLARVDAYCDTPRGAFVEVHYERGYDEEALAPILRRAGFEGASFSAHPGGGEPYPGVDRLWVTARRPAVGS